MSSSSSWSFSAAGMALLYASSSSVITIKAHQQGRWKLHTWIQVLLCNLLPNFYFHFYFESASCMLVWRPPLGLLGLLHVLKVLIHFSVKALFFIAQQKAAHTAFFTSIAAWTVFRYLDWSAPSACILNILSMFASTWALFIVHSSTSLGNFIMKPSWSSKIMMRQLMMFSKNALILFQ